MVKANKEKKEDVMVVTDEGKKRYNALVGQMNREYRKVEASSLKLAFALHEIYFNRYFEVDGYKNIYEFGADRFQIARGTCNNFINIVERFAVKDSEGNVLVGDGSGLREDVSKFSFSKLCALLTVPDNLLSDFNSGMTVKEIREMKDTLLKGIDSDSSENVIDSDDEKENADSVKRVMNAPEYEEVASDCGSNIEDEAGLKRKYVSFASFVSTDDFAEQFSKPEYITALCVSLDKFLKTVLSENAVTIEFGVAF